MATSGELIEIVATALRLPPETLTVHRRLLRDAGLLSKKGHGKAAARMTSYDAAAMVLAAAGSPFVKDSVETVRAFGSLETDRDVLTRLEANEGAPLARTLLAHLAYEFDVLNDDANRGRLRGPYTELFISPDDENYFGIGAFDFSPAQKIEVVGDPHGFPSTFRARAERRSHMRGFFQFQERTRPGRRARISVPSVAAAIAAKALGQSDGARLYRAAPLTLWAKPARTTLSDARSNCLF